MGLFGDGTSSSSHSSSSDESRANKIERKEGAVLQRGQTLVSGTERYDPVSDASTYSQFRPCGHL